MQVFQPLLSRLPTSSRRGLLGMIAVLVLALVLSLRYSGGLYLFFPPRPPLLLLTPRFTRRPLPPRLFTPRIVAVPERWEVECREEFVCPSTSTSSHGAAYPDVEEEVEHR